MQKYNIAKVKHGFEIDRYCKLQNIQNVLFVFEYAILIRYYE